MKRILLFLFGILISNMLFAQNGKIYDNLSMKSSILDGERKYAIYLPPDYETSQRSYPTTLRYRYAQTKGLSSLRFVT